MARPLQLLSLLPGFGALSVTPSGAVNCCRFASGGAGKAWAGQSHGQSHGQRDRGSSRGRRYRDEDEDIGPERGDDVEDKLQTLVDEGRKRQKTVKFHILRRQMTPPGAPHRELTWDAMEQIRYLKREQPEEWTVQRLAEGYSVTPDVILRVLRSKFVPAPERKAKQNAKVMAELGQRVLPSGAGTGQDGLKPPGNRSAPAVLQSGRREGADQALMLRGESSGSLVKSLPAPVTVLRAGVGKDAPEKDGAADTNPTEEDKGEEERWDGVVLTEEELEEFMEMEKSAPAAQVGNDFFDAEGNFLYRI